MDDVLRRNPLFAALDDEQAAELRASMSEVTLARGDSLFHEGDPGDRLYVVTEGKVKLHRTSPDGRENMLAVVGPSELIGELSLFDPGPRTATGTALTEVKLLGLGHGDLQPWLSARPEVAGALALTSEQQAALSAIATDYHARVAEVNALPSTPGWAELRSRALTEAREKARERMTAALTDRQRAAWRELTGPPNPAVATADPAAGGRRDP